MSRPFNPNEPLPTSSSSEQKQPEQKSANTGNETEEEIRARMMQRRVARTTPARTMTQAQFNQYLQAHRARQQHRAPISVNTPVRDQPHTGNSTTTTVANTPTEGSPENSPTNSPRRGR